VIADAVTVFPSAVGSDALVVESVRGFSAS
jgi:hypothetical protein